MLLGTLNTDGTTVQPIYVNPTNHAIKVDDASTGSGSTTQNVQRDQNRTTAIWGVSSADGVTPVAIWTDADGKLLIDSN